MLVHHANSVAIVAVDGDEVVLVRQRRPGAPAATLELPSGKIEPGETPAEAVSRELAEECGLAAGSTRELAAFWAVPAYSTEFVRVFEATGLSESAGRDPDADEEILVERATVADALERLDDAVSLAALALWQLGR